MKSSTRFFGVLITILIMAACSTNNADGTYPIQIGTWSVQSAQRANYTGTQPANVQNFAMRTAQPGDTTHITQPDSLSMFVVTTSTQNGFAIIINDSTLSQQEAESVNAKSTISNASGITFHNGAITGGSDFKGSLVQFLGTYSCQDSTQGNTATLNYSLYSDADGSLYRAYILDIGGFQTVLDRIVCTP